MLEVGGGIWINHTPHPMGTIAASQLDEVQEIVGQILGFCT